MSKEATKRALVFLCLFCVVVHFFRLVNTCFCCVKFVSDVAIFVLKRDVKLQLSNCCVKFCFSIPSQEIDLGNVSETTYFVWSGM